MEWLRLHVGTKPTCNSLSNGTEIRIPAAKIHGWLMPFLPKSSGQILDVGAGTGRDAAWLSSLGYNVVAVEPSTKMRQEAQRIHPTASIQWIDDQLPGLTKVRRLGIAFDFILLSAVWMHVAPEERARAFRKLVILLKPGGAIALTLRHGTAEDHRGIYEVTLGEVEHLAANHGAFVQRAETGPDELGRSSVSWTNVLVRLPDDGTGALPLLRHIILNDDKSSTYKLALLRVICRIADGASGFAWDSSNGHVAIPLGLVGLYWLRLFKPILSAGLPQTPTNNGLDGLGFVKEGFRALVGISHLDFKIGSQFTQNGDAVHAALKDACRTICLMPAAHITYPNGAPVLQTNPIVRSPRPSTIRFDEVYLSSFGHMLIPEHLWRAIRRFDVWIEPALVAEWTRLIKEYALRQGRQIEEATIAGTMAWSNPSREVRLARNRAVALMTDEKLFCVWTGKALTNLTLDIDHCIPWSSWPCEDLWNLLPADRALNQRQEREKLPSLELLRAAESRIKDWWATGFVDSGDNGLRRRFHVEASASLPTIRSSNFNLDDVFDAVALLQLRLTQDQQVPVWRPRMGTVS